MSARLSNYAIVLMSYAEENKIPGTLNRRLNSIFQCHKNSYNFCTFPSLAVTVRDYLSVCHSREWRYHSKQDKVFTLMQFPVWWRDIPTEKNINKEMNNIISDSYQHLEKWLHRTIMEDFF